MKKILVLGGASVHCKLVNAAKELGYYTIVTDYLPDSPAKKIADESWMINIVDVNEIVSKCREEGVDGVVCGWLDPCQRPYAQICSRLNLPCYASEEQVLKMTDKHLFKEMCRRNNVSVIPEYTLSDIEEGNVEYPVFVKPVDSRGSRGQAVCYDKTEALNAVESAKSESSNGDVIIEKYMAGAQEFQVTYFYVDGKPYLIRTADSYCGSEKNHLEKVVACAVSPSRYTDEYLSGAHKMVVKMFNNLGVENGPIFMQGFYKDGEFYFFDPGFRFPGVDYDRILKREYNLDLMKAMVEYAVLGKMSDVTIEKDCVYINQHRAAVLFPTVKPGVIKSVGGVDKIKNNENVVSYLERYTAGDTVGRTYNVNQRLCEIDIAEENTERLKELIMKIQDELTVTDADGNDMTFEKFDCSKIV